MIFVIPSKVGESRGVRFRQPLGDPSTPLHFAQDDCKGKAAMK
jgi:hypothetical protein